LRLKFTSAATLKKGGSHPTNKLNNMKLNKTLMIAALIAGSVFAADVAVRAQDATNKPSTDARPPAGPGNRGRMNFDFISQQLSLSEDQKPKVKPILEDMQKQMADLRKDTTVQGTDRRAKMKEIRDGATTKLKDVLTPDQLAKWEKMGQGQRRSPATAAPAPGGDNKPPQ
jgi:Spy/CpxP family protein refolding chaperone